MIIGTEESIVRKMQSRGITEDEIASFLEVVERANQKSPFIELDSAAGPSSEFILEMDADSRALAEMDRLGRTLLNKVVVIKLNGGRSTTMGGDVPKGILAAKDGRSYLELILAQMRSIRESWNVTVPLILMNSFFTHEPSMEIVRKYDVPVKTFIQKQVPRLVRGSRIPADFGSDADWVPPGHGDVYESFNHSGLLDRFLQEGYRWAFISNLDNLAAGLEPWILGLLQKQGIDFLLEVTRRTSADKKGGTLIRRNGRLELLEIAQVAPDQRDGFMDIERFQVFNTNNVWVDLQALKTILNDKTMNLPIIQNFKTISGVDVVQLETAMGAAIGSFPRARGLKVGRDRFFPTKKIEDLFVLQSDACVLDSMNRLRRNSERPQWLSFMPAVSFDSKFLDSPLKIGERFEDPTSVSLVQAGSLKISGPVFVGRDVKIRGEVEIVARPGRIYRIAPGCVLTQGRYPRNRYGEMGGT